MEHKISLGLAGIDFLNWWDLPLMLNFPLKIMLYNQFMKLIRKLCQQLPKLWGHLRVSVYAGLLASWFLT